MSFDLGQTLQSTLNVAQSALTASIYDANSLLSSRRAITIPKAGELIADAMTIANMFDGGNADDWRVRLSLSPWVSFRTSPVLTPLNASGGLIFPYTPTITIGSNAYYSKIQTTHSNHAFNSFKNADSGTITIVAPMIVEDATQGLYWVAMVHYLRSLTKMFTGTDMKAGNPPPVIKFNAYGNYVFKDVPVVVTAFTVTMESTCDYLGVNVVGSLATGLGNIADGVSGLLGTAGGAVAGLSGLAAGAANLANGVGTVAGVLGTIGIGGSTGGGTTYVPTKSTFNVTLQPMYSRDNTRKFSLDRFVTGGYLGSGVGYI